MNNLNETLKNLPPYIDVIGKMIGEYKCTILHSKIDNKYTIFQDNDGGAIITDENLDIAERKFLDAMNFYEVIRPIIHETYFVK